MREFHICIGVHERSRQAGALVRIGAALLAEERGFRDRFIAAPGSARAGASLRLDPGHYLVSAEDPALTCGMLGAFVHKVAMKAYPGMKARDAWVTVMELAARPDLSVVPCAPESAAAP